MNEINKENGMEINKDDDVGTLGIFNTFDEWKTAISHSPMFSAIAYNFDFDAIRWLSENIDVSGYMGAPIAVLENKPIQAQVKVIKAADGLKTFVDHYKDSGKRIYLYMALYYPEKIDYLLDNPKANESGAWRIRYAVID